MLADEVDYVIGVDTHRDQQVLAVVAAATGAVVAQHSLRADRSGYEAALRLACRYAPTGVFGRSRVPAITALD